MKQSTAMTIRTDSVDDSGGHTNPPAPATLFDRGPELPVRGVDGTTASRPGNGSGRNRSARPLIPELSGEVIGQGNGHSQSVAPSQVHERGRSESRVPRLARLRLSKAAYVLLEAVKGLPPGWEEETNYQRLMFATGFRSRTTIAKALHELEKLGVITTEKIRDHGKVTGLWFQYHGVPATLPEPTRQAYLKDARHELDVLSHQMNRVRFEIQRLEESGATPHATNGAPGESQTVHPVTTGSRPEEIRHADDEAA